jgi:hypothetical protein
MSLGPPPARAAAWQTLTVAAGRAARAGVEFRGRTDLLGSACDKFGGISGESRRCPEGSTDGRCDRWRIFASLCVTVVAEKTPKSRLFDSFLAENQGVNRRQGQVDRGRLSPRGRASPVRSPSSADLVPARAKSKAPSVATAEASRRLPRPTAHPSRPLAPPASPCRPAIRGDGFPRSHGPAKDIVNHQTVNVQLRSLRPPAAPALMQTAAEDRCSRSAARPAEVNARRDLRLEQA